MDAHKLRGVLDAASLSEYVPALSARLADLNALGADKKEVLTLLKHPKKVEAANS